jgi:hypothetical protein
MSQADSRSTPIPSPKPSRRAVLAGVAAAPALATPALALSGADRPREGGDPIFAAIERHKAAYRIQMEAGRIRCHTIDAKWDPEYDPVKCEAAKEAYTAAADASDDAAADALTTIRPTTMAGVLALLHHVEAFNAGAFFLDPWPDSTVRDWQSKPTFWPSWEDEDGIDLFGYAVLANVRAALEGIGATVPGLSAPAGVVGPITPDQYIAHPARGADPVFAAIVAREGTLAAEDAAAADDAADDVLDALADADAQALRALLRTPPTTLAGVTALLRYVVECKEADDYSLDTYNGHRTFGDGLQRTLLTALERLA